MTIRHPRHGELEVLAVQPLSVQVAPVGDPGDTFWLQRKEYDRCLAPVANTGFDRTPVASDKPWQAFLRAHARVQLRTHPSYLERALDRLEKETGQRVAYDDSCVDARECYWPTLSLTISWAKGHGTPADLPPVNLHQETNEYVIANNELALELLRLGVPFGCGHRKGA